ncbi:37S ribosomal protein-like protein S5 [Dendryphion nanum]|uniref:Small ribosomal subunit protein uS5m n=1 Tax=Dendryphion nanum TaxID=256645 RepID=A0A9P9D7V1_9PLEO|nr:37S ribosomal protein-like protein S5 [Dendryphion nanum]
MSVCRPARCLFSKATILPKPSPTTPPKRSFQTTATRPSRRRRPHYPSIKAEDLQLLNQAAETRFPKYNPAETKLLENRYTPSQLAAIKAAETAIDTKDLLVQGQPRDDTWRLPYEDTLAEMDPVTDHAEKLSHHDLKGKKTFRLANPVERDEAIQQVANSTLAKMYPNGAPEGQLDATEQKKLEEAMEAALTQATFDPRAIYTSKNPAVLEALADPRHSVILPSLPRIENSMVKQTRRLANEEEEDPRERQLLQHLGASWDKQRLRRLKIKTLVTHRVVNQTRMGKIQSMYFLTIAGNADGLLGVGEGKSVEPEDGRKQSVMAAIRNMKPIPRYENRTIFGNLEQKVGATKVLLMSRPPGFGLRVQHLIFEMARAAGLQDLAARTPRSRNKMNVVKATWEALVNQKLPDEIARGRGKKLVDVRKVYYGGSVH